MAELRWILLLLGLLILVAIYLWGLRNRQGNHFSRYHKRRSSAMSGGRGNHSDPDIAAELEEELTEDLESLAFSGRQAPSMGDDNAVEAEDNPEEPSIGAKIVSEAPTDNKTSAKEHIIVMHIVPEGEELFTGKQIVAAMKKAGFYYGKMKIFHRIVEVDGKKEQLYGIANMVEPGVFEPAALEKLRSPGLTVFLQLPGPIRGVDAFDRMISDANELKGALNGTLLNDKREPMDQTWIDHLRVRLISEAA